MAVKSMGAGQLFDYLIIGAGPAGLQLAWFLAQAGRSYLVLEEGDSAGTFFKKFPRHRTLISINKIYTGYDDEEVNLRWDWNSLLSDRADLRFTRYSTSYFPHADVMVRYLCDYAERLGLAIRYGTKVVEVTRHGGGFLVVDEAGGRYRARRLVIATGVTKPYVCPVPGIELAENYVDVSVDPADFTNQRVLILGKGNSAFETADNLIPTTSLIHLASPHPVRLAWKTHHVGHLRAVNNNFLDTYQLKAQNACLDADIRQLIRRPDGKLEALVAYTHADGEVTRIAYDRAIACTGFRFDPAIFDDSCRPDLAIYDRFPAQTSSWQSTNVPDLYFAGTLTQMRDFKKYNSGFIHGFRYNLRALFRIFERTYHDREWPSRAVEDSPEAMTEAVLASINRSAALWQQFGAMCDVVTAPRNGRRRYLDNVPVDYAHDGDFGAEDDYYTVNLEFGKSEADPMSVVRYPEPGRAAESFFLHPVVRHYNGSELIGERHILEDLEGQWRKEKLHVAPLREFFAAERRAQSRVAVAV